MGAEDRASYFLDISEMYRLVGDCSANVNEQNYDGNTLLHLACYAGNRDKQGTDIVEELMTLGADANVTNSWKDTPVDMATMHKHNRLLPLFDLVGVMDTHIRKLRLRSILRNSISVYSIALVVHTCIHLAECNKLASILYLFAALI
jgi:hypothetical protein